MDLYPRNQPIRLSTTVRDIAGALADPGALVLTYVNVAPASVLVTKNWPTPADITRESLGLFHYDVPAGLAVGHYRYEWQATGAAAGDDPDVFDVFDPAAYPRLVSFADAKSYVKLLGTGDDALLDRMVGWASARILREVVAYNTTYTQTVTARGGRLRLSRVPVRTITAIIGLDIWAVPMLAADLYPVVPMAGMVKSASGQWPNGTYSVTYTAGYDEVPPGVDGACLDLIQHWWRQAQSHGSATYGDSGFVPDFAGLPNIVKNKLAVVPKAPMLA